MNWIKRLCKNFQYNSPVTLTFALISLITLVLGALSKGRITLALFCVYRSSLGNPFTYIRLFTHVLGHADWSHFSSNMMLFLVLGPMLEEKYGSFAFIKMIGITAFISGVFYTIFYPETYLLGASGVVFMMIVLSAAAGMKDRKIPITLVLVMLIYLSSEVVNAFGSQDGIAHTAHIVGGICGAGFGFFMKGKNMVNKEKKEEVSYE